MIFSLSFADAIPCACCFGSFSHQLSECILNAKATSHMAPTQEAAGLGTTVLKLINNSSYIFTILFLRVLFSFCFD